MAFRDYRWLQPHLDHGRVAVSKQPAGFVRRVNIRASLPPANPIFILKNIDMYFCIVFFHTGTFFCAVTLLPAKSVREAEKNEAQEGGAPLSTLHSSAP